jgi:hypothetical protein
MRLLLSGEKASLSAADSSNADVKRSCHLINTHGVFGTHNSAQSAGGFRETPPSATIYAVPVFIRGMSDEETLNAHVLARP